MVKKLSDNIALYISREMNYDQEKFEILSYGLEIFLGGFFKTLALVVLSLALGLFNYTVVGMVSFALFRVIIGGTHADTYEKCFVISLALLLGIGAAGKHFYFLADHVWLIFIVFGQALTSILIWVPAGTEKKTIKNRSLRIKMKVIALIFLAAWMILILSIPSYYYQQYAFSSILGVSSAFFLVTPPAYKLFQTNLILLRG